ncbi:MAG: helix-turn-helix domain-containing protein [Flavobacteriaceae bacterium]|jgi:transcriptional regulator with XRE-family HTH domain|nr:helix-turn-helix domain-containing protein [Flavobacteriaceae bacterium]
MALGKKLMKLRISKNLTKESLAQKLGVSKTAYGKWESDLAKPGFDNIILLSDFYGISKDELMEDEEKSVSQNNNTFNNSPNIVYSPNPTINYTLSEEMLEKIIENQRQISEIVQTQNKLFEKFIPKK